MRRILLLTILALSIYTSKSQNLSFTCPRDTILGCNTACFTIKGQFPDLRSLADDYTVKNVTAGSACRPYIDPGAPGPSANVSDDDFYSAKLTLPFNFPFYGITYPKAVISTNGYISFDTLRAGLSSHYSILFNGTGLSATSGMGYPGQNVPTTLYDKALIMGPYHDIDPFYTTSPTQQIKYETFGTAPNRKWIVSFYKIPLFLTGAPDNCDQKIQNTHQIILHESTGVVEVYIRDIEQCPGWNDARSMVGMQDESRTKGIMPPGRAANDPVWGNIGMNETWRFIPKNGAPLYRGVQLLDGTGAVIATGDTTRVDVNTFEVSFPNICPPAGASVYVIKTTYQKIDDPTPGATIYSLDTINVTRTPSLPLDTSMVQTACSLTTGSITITAAGGVPPYTFTMTGPGGPYAPVTGPSNTATFSNLGAGTYTLTGTDGAGCTGTVTETVTNVPNLTATHSTTPPTCPGVNNGVITITPDLGAAAGPYSMTLTGPGGPWTFSFPAVFSMNMFAAGTYTATFSNAGGCSGTINNIIVGPGTAPTSANSHLNTSCPGANNGTVTVTPNGGAAQGPYNITMTGPGGPYTATGVATTYTFIGLAAGTYSITFTNAAGCTSNAASQTVGNNTSPSAGITGGFTSCAGGSDGTVTVTPSGGAAQGPYTITLNGPGGPYVQTGVVSVAVFNVGAGTYSATFTNAAGCNGSSTTSALVASGPPLTGTFTNSPSTSCPGVNDGTITVNPGGGAAGGPYNFTLNPGAIPMNGIPNSATYTGLAPNTYTVSFTNAAGCTGTVGPITITQGPGVSGSSTHTNTTCPTRNDGTITVTPTGVGPFTYTLNPGAVVQVNNPVFTGLAAGTYTITFTTASGCGGTVTPNPVIDPGPYLSSTFSQFDPPCANTNNGTITINPGGVAPYSFTLTGPGGPYTQPTPTFSNLAPGTYNYSFTDGNGCTGTGGPVTLTTHSPLALTVTLTQPLCNGNSNGIITLAASGGLAAYEYAQSPFTVYQPSGTFNGFAAGTYTFRVRDAAGCTKDTTVTLGEPTLLTASATNTTPASCSGNDGTITVTGAGGTPGYTYSIDGVNYQAGNVFTAPAVGPYPNIKVKDANGCIASASTTVVLVDAMYLTLGNDTTICVGSSVTMQPITNPETSVFNWRPLDPLVTLPSTIANPTVKNAVMTPTDTATYILNAKWGACVREDTIIVNVLHKPVAHAGSDTSICQYTFAILRGSATNLSGPVNYSWAPAASVQDPTLPVTNATPAATQNYTLTVTDNYGCNFSVTDDVLVTVQPPVPAFAGNDTTAILGVPHQLFGSGGVDYLWSPSAPLDLATSQNPVATLSHDQLFILKVTDIAGCIGYDSVLVQVYQGPNYLVPNAFSPNNDGENDIFRAIPVGMTTTEYFRVFNRYGQLVFETNQWLKGWNGKYRGKDQPMGTYVWVVKGTDKNGRPVEMKGTVLLIR